MAQRVTSHHPTLPFLVFLGGGVGFGSFCFSLFKEPIKAIFLQFSRVWVFLCQNPLFRCFFIFFFVLFFFFFFFFFFFSYFPFQTSIFSLCSSSAPVETLLVFSFSIFLSSFSFPLLLASFFPNPFLKHPPLANPVCFSLLLFSSSFALSASGCSSFRKPWFCQS